MFAGEIGRLGTALQKRGAKGGGEGNWRGRCRFSQNPGLGLRQDKRATSMGPAICGFLG